ncbi:MAG: SDR family NAD(P)-dependent oxidoreductase [Rhodospirillales bacterium]|nr:SDR family NAD(P)-dependent oxidoreductase [Rhodospirillales bacterium]
MADTVWITGAGKGIGRALALLYAAKGRPVAISARTEKDLDTLAEEAAPLPGLVRAYTLDVTNEDDVRKTVEAIEAEMGPIALAVLNAGTHIPVHAKSFESGPFRTLTEVNFFGVVHGLTALIPRMIERRSGHLAVVSSVSGYRGLPTASAYGATKAALINMCEALKPELEQNDVSLSLIKPGFVKTPLTDRNDFPMPFLVSAEEAAERIAAGLDRKAFEIAFPRLFVWGLKLMRCLPYALYFRLVRRLVRQ